MSKQYTRAEVLAARKTAIDFLLQPQRKKALEQLSRGGENRCCLGHMCQALDPDRKTGWRDEFCDLSSELQDRLGMWNGSGRSSGGVAYIRGTNYRSLARLNDETDMTPQQIGALLSTMIEGGKDTPFRPLADFPESLD